MLSPHGFFFFGVIGDVVEGGREGLCGKQGGLAWSKCGAWHWRTITASSHTTWGHLRLIITTSGGDTCRTLSGFERLPSARGEFEDSPEFMLSGNPWCLWIYPGGYEDSAEGMASLYLCYMSNKAIEIDFWFQCQ